MPNPAGDPPPGIPSAARLAPLLKEAADAHHAYQDEHPEHKDWWDWYAPFVVARLYGYNARLSALIAADAVAGQKT